MCHVMLLRGASAEYFWPKKFLLRRKIFFSDVSIAKLTLALTIYDPHDDA